MKQSIDKILFSLLRFEIAGTEIDEEIKNLITPQIFPGVYGLAKHHTLAHLIVDALEKNGFLAQQSKEEKRSFLRARNVAVYSCAQHEYAFKDICGILEEIQVSYLPLKGSVIRAYYPEPWMRTSGDIDILVRKEDIDVCVEKLCANGYTLEGDHYHDISLYSENNVHLELHYELIEERDSSNCHEMLENIWDELLPMENCHYGKRMSEELFFFYHLAHMAKHFVHGGCGIRPFLDLWIMERKMSCDKEKLQKMLQRGGLLSFYEYARKISEYWFSGEKADDTVKEMEDYVLRGGVYGTVENKVAVNRGKSKNKSNYIFSSVFLPYENLCQIYPALKGKKWLTPFYQVKRWFKKLFKGVSKGAQATLRAYDTVTDEQTQRINGLLETLGLHSEDGADF